MQAFQKALDLEPQDVALLNSLGYAAAYAGELAAGMGALRRYQALRPKDANPLHSMGDINLASGRLAEAERFYLQAAQKDPDFLNGGDLLKAAMAHLMTADYITEARITLEAERQLLEDKEKEPWKVTRVELVRGRRMDEAGPTRMGQRMPSGPPRGQ